MAATGNPAVWAQCGRVAGAVTALAGLACGPRLSILIFHRVRAGVDPIFSEEPDVEGFDRILRFLSRGFSVLTLSDAMDRLARGCLPARAATITFDDGYADNAEIALPLLQRYEMRATFFVSTGFVNGGRMWNDTVIESFQRTSVTQADLSELGLGSRDLSTTAARRSAIDATLQVVKYQSLDQREDSLSRLCAALRPGALPNDLMMTRGQVQELAAAGMEIGGHTVHHPILARIEDDQAMAEMVEGRRWLQSAVDAPVDSFAYPNGRPQQDYLARHVRMARQAGFRHAVSTSPGVVTSGADAFQLPRFTPWGQSAPQWALRFLARRLAGKHAARCESGQ